MKALWQQALALAKALAAQDNNEIMVAVGGLLVAMGNDIIARYTAKAFGAPPDDPADVDMAVSAFAECIVAMGGQVPAAGVGLEALKILLPILLELLLKKKQEAEEALAA
jgi:hypothetical protein